MLRISLLLVAVALTVSAGCTHCDTADDFPIPCVGGNCGQAAVTPTATGTFAGYTPAPVVYQQAPVAAPATVNDPGAPVDLAPAPTPPSVPRSGVKPAPGTDVKPLPAAPDADMPAPIVAPEPDAPAPSASPKPGSPTLPVAPSSPTVVPMPNEAASTPPAPLGPEGSPGSGS